MYGDMLIEEGAAKWLAWTIKSRTFLLIFVFHPPHHLGFLASFAPLWFLDLFWLMTKSHTHSF